MTRGARAQGFLAIAGLVVAVAVTVLMVATPVSSRPAQRSSRVGPVLDGGVKVEVRGGDPFLAYRVADQLSLAGATLGSVVPDADRNVVEDATMIVYYERGQLASAERIKTLLGRGDLRHQRVFEPDVDVTIVLGKDLSRL